MFYNIFYNIFINKKIREKGIELLSNIISPGVKHLLKKWVKIPALSDDIYEKADYMFKLSNK